MADSGLKKEPMFRIAKRSDISRKKAVIIRIIAFLLALVVCGVFVFVLTKENPLSVYMGMGGRSRRNTKKNMEYFKGIP